MHGLGTTTQCYFSVTNRIGRIQELDGLRGIAILLVLLRHAVRPIVEQHGTLLPVGPWDLSIPLLNGWMGVDLFFVLSGFLITYHLLSHWPTNFNWRFFMRYWEKRLLRTFPAYLVAVLVALSGFIPLYDVSPASTSSSLLIHLLFLQDYFGSDLVPAFWSLGVEEKFYLLCPLVLLYVKRLTSKYQLVTMIALALLPMALRLIALGATDTQHLDYSEFFWTIRSPFHLAMDGLWTGVVCALIYSNAQLREHVARAFKSWRITNFSLIVLMVVMCSFAWFDDRWFYASSIGLSVIALGFGCLMLGSILERSWVSRALRAVWLRALSTISYSVYLVHLMFVPLALLLAKQLLPAAETDAVLHLLAFAPVFLAFSIVAGVALHFAVEKPFLIFKDRIVLSSSPWNKASIYGEAVPRKSL